MAAIVWSGKRENWGGGGGEIPPDGDKTANFHLQNASSCSCTLPNLVSFDHNVDDEKRGEVLQRDTKSSLTHLTQKSRCLHPLHILHERTNERTLFLSFKPGTYQARRKGYLSFNFIYRCCDKVRTRNQINEDSPCREGYLPSFLREKGKWSCCCRFWLLRVPERNGLFFLEYFDKEKSNLKILKTCKKIATKLDRF